MREMDAVGTEHDTHCSAIRGESELSGTESGTLGGVSAFGDAVAAVTRLPLSDAENAEAVRRLLR